MRVPRPVFLVGFMGAGKSTVGRIVAERLERPFCDLDDQIEILEGRSVDDLFATVGESGFREAEHAALRAVAARRDVVVACGGGVVTDEESRVILRESGEVVYLEVSADEAMTRMAGETVGRPLMRADDIGGMSGLLASRERLYRSVADLTIDTVGHTPEEIGGRIVLWVETSP